MKLDQITAGMKKKLWKISFLYQERKYDRCHLIWLTKLSDPFPWRWLFGFLCFCNSVKSFAMFLVDEYWIVTARFYQVGYFTERGAIASLQFNFLFNKMYMKLKTPQVFMSIALNRPRDNARVAYFLNSNKSGVFDTLARITKNLRFVTSLLASVLWFHYVVNVLFAGPIISFCLFLREALFHGG
jgi:hypothetical protein